eukprot:5615772-Pyramimonas_sp.AAC.1
MAPPLLPHPPHTPLCFCRTYVRCRMLSLELPTLWSEDGHIPRPVYTPIHTCPHRPPPHPPPPPRPPSPHHHDPFSSSGA